MKQVVIRKSQDFLKVNSVAKLMTFYSKGMFSVNMGIAVDVSKTCYALSYNFHQAGQGFDWSGPMEGCPLPMAGRLEQSKFPAETILCFSWTAWMGWGQVISWLWLCSEGAN